MTRRGWALFLALSVIWGIPYLLIKVAVTEVSPAVMVFGRCALGAAVLLPLAAARGVLVPSLRHWPWIAVFAAVELGGPFGLLGLAERHISSSLTGLLVASAPLVGAVLAVVLGADDRLDARRWAGLLVGVAGVAALVGLDVRGGDLIAVGAVGLVAIGYAVGPVVVATRLGRVSGLGSTAIALTLVAVAYAPLAWRTRPRPVSPPGVPSGADPLAPAGPAAEVAQAGPAAEVAPAGPAIGLASVSPQAWAAIAVLGLVCSALALLLFFALVAEVGPSRSVVITYLNPAVAVLLGVVVLSEPMTAGLLVGFPLVLLGSWLATRRPGSPTRPEAHQPWAKAA